MKKSQLKLKIALLSICFITASVNAIAGNIPAIAKDFPRVPLHIFELMTTIPSLTMMLAILFSHHLCQKIGYKKSILLASLLCGVSGIVPYFIKDIYMMIIARALFGIGVGILSSSLLILILYFFDGEAKSNMIGLQGSIGGLGSFLTTWLSGHLVVYGWNVSFLTYLVSFVVGIIVFIGVPSIEKVQIETPQETQVSSSYKNIAIYSVLSFLSVCLATFFVIKCSTLITLNNYGNTQQGSILIMLISIGSLLSGAMYGRIYSRLRDMSLPLFYVLCAVAFYIAGFSQSIMITIISAFILGYGYMAFVPFLQEKVGIYGTKGTQTLLVLQSLGSFVAPYYGKVLDVFQDNLNIQFLLSGSFFIVLVVISIILKRKSI